jgi:Fe-S oxidoreductase
MDQGETGSPLSWVRDDTLWSCTTCGACDHACPVGIDVYHKIIDLRRARVESGVIPDAAEHVFESIASSQNPFGRPNSERLNWAHGLKVPLAEGDEPVELLYWVGCAGSFDPDGQSVARSMVKILNHLGIGYRVLGCGERCTGDPARRMGEEGLFQQQAAANLETLRRHRVRRILTHCPHCLNVFRNEYPQLSDGVAWAVTHHSEFLAETISQGVLKPAMLSDELVTFHDPCYLGRGNGIVAAPRVALQGVISSAPVEMPRHGADSFCCGAGGGTMWVDVPAKDRVEHLRAREAAATKASTVVTACPFCRVMLRTGLETVAAEPPEVRDLAELVAERL